MLPAIDSWVYCKTNIVVIGTIVRRHCYITEAHCLAYLLCGEHIDQHTDSLCVLTSVQMT